jgi:hypothetical protein
MPFRTLAARSSDATSWSSPFEGINIPSDVEMSDLSEGGKTSQAIFKAVALKTANQRADLFVSGKFDHLLRSLNVAERRSVSRP